MIPFTLNQLGIAYEKYGDDRKAEDTFKRGLQYNPHACELLVNLGNFYRRKGSYDEARRMFDMCDVDQSSLSTEHKAIYYHNFGLIGNTHFFFFCCFCFFNFFFGP